MMKRVSMITFILVVALIAGGCINKSVSISWSPNPIVVKEGATEIKGTATLRVSGISSGTIDTVSAIGYDKDGEEVPGMKEIINVNRTIPFFVSGEVSENIVFPISHAQALNSNVREVKITVTGSISGTLTIKVNVEEPNSDPI